MKSLIQNVLLTVVVMTVAVESLSAQQPANSQLAKQQQSMSGMPELRRSMTMSQVSRTYVPPTLPEELVKGELVKVVVKRKAIAISEGEVNNKLKAHGEWGLTKWLQFDGMSLIPTAMEAGTPAVAGMVDTKYKGEGSVETLESVEFTIKCQIKEERPNGLLLIEGDDYTQINDEQWLVKFSGLISADDVLPDRSILSENVYMPWIEKSETGQVRDAYRRGWLQKFLDVWKPI